VDAELLDVQNIGTSYRVKIPGNLSSPDSSSLTLYLSKNGVDARVLLGRGVSGFLMFLDGGDVVAYKAEVYPVTVASHAVMRTTGGTEASKVLIRFAITAAPAQGVAVPA
jgi:hypothetical protein